MITGAKWGGSLEFPWFLFPRQSAAGTDQSSDREREKGVFPDCGVPPAIIFIDRDCRFVSMVSYQKGIA